MDSQEAAVSRTAGGAAAGNGSDATATATVNGLGALGLQRPPRRPGPLPSYVSEPPSTLAMMKTYAQELLLQQEQQRDEQQQQTAQQPAGSLQRLPPPPARLQRTSSGSGGIPAARSGGSTPHGAAFNVELPPLGPRQFDAAPRRHTAPTEATPPLKRNLRTSIGRQEWALMLLLGPLL